MDDFGCYDYKQPASTKVSDMRTSTYRGHRHITDLRMGNRMNAKYCSHNNYVRDPLMHDKQFTEYEAKYEWQYADPNILRNPSLNMKSQYMKPFEQGNLRFIKRKIKPISSVTQDTFVEKILPVELDPIRIPMQTPVEATKLIIDRSKIGYSKYTDPSATTYNLAYVRYPPNELSGGIAAHDNVTFWNWSEEHKPSKKVARYPDATMCDDFPAKDCPKRRCEFQNTTKSVPHTGMSTEVRDNYIDPQFRAMEFNVDVKPLMVYEAITPFSKKSEYAIYGSGEPVVKYV
ncbi:GL19394 [Drosophila persimilis]|uniref:Stabilizer of axonemal microtubules 1 n=2 Tax=pseudoobscura subgroup TaxID=32358 RepID=Q29MM2_DROPS|nr:uncharacterized protein LOC4817291 [Drosophila pseudoobscura]XP_002014848.1 uncharacterized protein LOC6588763 [Drosophila persimilis]EDW28844.1 GL19394 [Drosophila persimilis]